MENLEQKQPTQPQPAAEPQATGAEPLAPETPEAAPQPPTPLVPENKPKSPFFSSILLSLVMFVLGGGLVFGYFRFLKSEKVAVSQPTVSPTPSLTPTPSPSPDVTTDWKIYKNATYGYSLRYPKDWEINAKNAEESTNATLHIFKGKGNYYLTISLNLVGVGGGGPFLHNDKKVTVSGRDLYRVERYKIDDVNKEKMEQINYSDTLGGRYIISKDKIHLIGYHFCDYIYTDCSEKADPRSQESKEAIETMDKIVLTLEGVSW